MRRQRQSVWASALAILCLVPVPLVASCGRAVQVPTSAAPDATLAATATAPPATIQPTPSPTPTLSPAVRIENANRALRDGDYEAAIEQFQQVLQVADEQLSQQLVLPLARAYFAAGQYEELAALQDRRDFEALAVSDRAIALGLLARSFETLEQWEKAIFAYERYLELDDAAAHQVRQQIARAYQALGQPDRAADHLQQIDLAELDASTQATVLEELAGLLAELGASERALELYDQILSFARTAWYRSVILLHKGQLLLDKGREEEGVGVLHEAVGQYPQTWGAYAAMQTLDQIDAAEISLLQRGEILYHLGQNEQSIEALERYRLTRPFGFHSTAHLYAGLAYHALGRYEDAVDEFDKVILEFGWTAVAGDAWMAKARALAALGEEPSTLYREFVKRFPDHPRAPEALWRAAVGLERRGDWAQAGGFYAALCDEYADDSRAEEACFRQGLAAYAVGDHHHALDVWERSLAALPPEAGPANESSSRARALTWIGLASAAAGENESAEALWREAADPAPESYYAWRARDLIAGDPLQLSVYQVLHVPPFELSKDSWRQIEDWVQDWAPGEDDPYDPIQEQTLVRRGDALWALGWHDDALDAYRQHRDAVAGEAQSLLALLRHSFERDVLAMVISCAERLIWMGRAADADEPPRALLWLAYPTAYGHLISSEAEPLGIDPLLFLALVRQESQFNPYVTSWAGAVGLAQVMPQTGAWIAQKIGPEAYDDALLLRPVVSVRYGVWYLAGAREVCGDSWPAAVAAYNAGWTNVGQWIGNEPIHDFDLFYETIPFSETQAFVRLVYENYRAYQRIYRPHF